MNESTKNALIYENCDIILEKMNDIIFIVSSRPNYEILDTNLYLKRLKFPIRESSLIGTSILKYFSEDNKSTIQKMLSSKIKRKFLNKKEEFKLIINKNEIWVELDITKGFKGDDGNPLIMLMKNVTDRSLIRAENQIMKSQLEKISSSLPEIKFWNLLTNKDTKNVMTQFKDQLSKAEEKIHYQSQLVDNVSEAIISTDLDYKIKSWNKAAERMYGWKEEVVLGKQLHQLLKSDLIDETTESASESLKTTKFWKGNAIQETKRGKKIWISCSARLYENKNDGSKIIVAINQDNTDLKKAEFNLKESEKRYRLISENANDLIRVLDSQLRIEYINSEAHFKELGHEEGDLLGKPSKLLLNPEEANMTRSFMKKVFETGEAIREARLKQKSGDWKWFEIRTKRFKDEEGQEKFLSISRDITARKQGQEKLKESEEKYRFITENIIDIISVFDKDLKLIYINEAHKSISGYSTEDVLHKSPLEFIHPEDQIKAAETLRDSLNTGSSRAIYRMRNKAGGYNWMDASVRKIEDPGRKITFIMVSRDITEQIELERKLKSSEQKFRHLFERSPSSIVLMDMTGKVIDCNEQFELIYGYNKEELLTQSPFIFTRMYKNPNELELMLRTIFRGKNLIQHETQVIRKSQEMIWIEVSATHFEMGEKNYILFISQDITDRHDYELKLKESETKFRILYENANDGIMLLNSEGIIIDVNMTTLGLFSAYSKKKLISRPFFEFSPYIQPDGKISGQKIEALFYKALNGESYKFYWKCERINGRSFDATISLNLVELSGEPMIQVMIKDITSELKAQKELKDSEEKYRTLFNSAPIGIVIATLGGEIIDLNERMAEMSGYTIEEHRTLNISKIYANPKVRAQLIETLRKEGRVRNFDVIKRKKDGSFYNELINMDLVIINGENVVFTTCQDITEKFNLLKRVQESEEKFRRIFEDSQLGIMIVDSELNTLDVNAKLSELTGYSRGELLKLKFEDFTHPDDLKKEIKYTNQLFLGDLDSYTLEKRYIKKNGEIIWIDLIASKICNKEGAVLYGLGMINDITDRKETEVKLKTSEMKYRQLFERSPFSIVLFNLDGTLKDCNKAALEMTGFSKEDVIGKNFSELKTFDLGQLSEINDRYDNLINNVSTGPKEILGIKKDGSKFWILSTISLIQLGEDKYIQGIMHDITDRKRAEQNYKLLFETMAEGAVYQDEDGNIISANQAASEILGVSIDEMLGRTSKAPEWKAIKEDGSEYPGEKHPSMVALRQGKAIKNVIMGVFNPIKEDYVWIIISAIPQFRSKATRPYQVYTTFSDITKLKQTQDLLKKSQEEYKRLSLEMELILDNLPGLVFYKDAQNNYLRVNRYLAEAHGMKKSKIEGMNCFDIYSEAIAQTYWDDDLQVIETGVPKINYIEPWENKDGKRWVYTCKIPIIEEDGNARRIVGFSIDVTERHQAEIEILKRLEFERVISKISTEFMKDQDFDQSIDKVLQYIGEFSGASRSYLFQLNNHLKLMNNTHEWCSEGVKSQMKNLQKIPTKDLPWWVNQLREGKFIHITDVKQLPEEAINTRMILEKQEIKSLLVIPIQTGDELIGFMGFDNVIKTGDWTEEDFEMLKISSEIFSGHMNRHDAEIKLKESEQKFKKIAENAPIGIQIINKGKIQYSNEYASNLSGYDIQELKQMTPAQSMEIIHPEDRKILKNYIQGIYNKKTLMKDHSQIRFLHKESNIVWVQYRLSELKYKGESADLVILSDITEQKEYANLIESLNQTLFHFTADSQKNVLSLTKTGRDLLKADEFLFVSKSFTFDAKEIVLLSSQEGRVNINLDIFQKNFHLADYFNENHGLVKTFYDLDKADNFDGDFLIKERGIKGSFGKLIGRDDNHNELICALFRRNPKFSEKDQMILNFLGEAIDIEIKRWDAQRKLEKQNISLNEINRMKTELISRTSHELKTPLISIKGFTDLILKVHTSKLDDEMRSLLAEIKNGAHRLEEIIKNLLEASRIDGGYLKLKREPLNLSKMIKSLHMEYQKLAQIKGVSIKCEIDPEMFVLADKQKLREAIINLLSNALKYTYPKGNISIMSQRVYGFYKIIIKDTGVGITETESEKIFQKFGKIERYGLNLDVDIEGTGLGLYIAKGIIKEHGGKIGFHSKGRDKGSSFYIKLPISD